MPNWVENQIWWNADENTSKRILKEVKGETDFDFQKLIPMPSSLDIEESSQLNASVMAYLTDFGKLKLTEELIREFNKIVGNPYYSSYMEDYVECKDTSAHTFTCGGKPRSMTYKEAGGIYATNAGNYGFPTWYGWCWKNWGTKWDACNISVGTTSVSFNTAWAPPVPVIQELSRRFPEVEFTTEWWDEDVSNNGVVKFLNGEYTEEQHSREEVLEYYGEEYAEYI